MKFSALQIASLLDGTVEGNPETEVWNVAKIEEGAPGMLSFLANPKYTSYIFETRSSIVIVNKDFVADKPIAATLIRVDDAYASFAKLLAFYDQLSQDKKGVSSLAFVSSTAKWGENFYLGEFAFIGENVSIGNNVKLYQGVTLGAKSFPLDEDGNPIKGVPRHPILEDDVIVYSNATILGRITLAKGTVVGGNLWVTESTQPGEQLVQAKKRKSHVVRPEDLGGI